MLSPGWAPLVQLMGRAIAQSVLAGAAGNPYPRLTPPSNPPCASAMIFGRQQPQIKHLETGTRGFLLVQGVSHPHKNLCSWGWTQPRCCRLKHPCSRQLE